MFVPTFQWISKLSGRAHCPQNTATAWVLHTRLSVTLKVSICWFSQLLFFYIYAELELAMALADSMSFIVEDHSLPPLSLGV